MSKEKILLTIAARGGSKGVKNKNIRPLAGRPLIAYTILQAKQWGRADKIICSTDSPQIARTARRYGAQVPFLRPARLATDTCGKIPVLRHALRTMEELDGVKYSILVDLDATAPVRRISDIEAMLRIFRKKRPDSVVSVTPSRRNPYFNMLEVNGRGFAHFVKKLPRPVVRRQDAPKVYDMNASIYVYDREYLLAPDTRIAVSSRTALWVMDEWSAFDVDSEVDFRLIEFLKSKNVVTL